MDRGPLTLHAIDQVAHTSSARIATGILRMGRLIGRGQRNVFRLGSAGITQRPLCSHLACEMIVWRRSLRECTIDGDRDGLPRRRDSVG